MLALITSVVIQKFIDSVLRVNVRSRCCARAILPRRRVSLRRLSVMPNPNILSISHLEDVADDLGELSIAQQEKDSSGGNTFEACFIVGEQIRGHKPNVYCVYPAGNHMKTSDSAPFLQIGESKYGKPVLDRIINPESSLNTAAMCGLVSMSSTVKSNLSVASPIEVVLYPRDSVTSDRHYVFEESSDYLPEERSTKDEKLREAFARMQPSASSGKWGEANTSNHKAK